VNDVNFVSLTINEPTVQVTLDDDFRDILGFKENTYQGKGTFSADKEFSLTRCINYFLIYSNVCDLTRIGETQSPLLAVIPFIPRMCKVITDKRFRSPMYIPVAPSSISQIDIAIYDDAGKEVSFHSEAKSIATLHFKQK
jgi:hypothetical protein